MNIEVIKTGLENIQDFRTLFLQECNFQIRYNACHERNWSDSYLLMSDGKPIGFGSVKGKNNLTDRDAVFEFFIIVPYRKLAHQIFANFLEASGASYIECQSNDLFLSSMLYEFSHKIYSDVVLFEDHSRTEIPNPDVTFRIRKETDVIFTHELEPVGDYVLELKDQVIATGGFMLHYNKPFADIYMEVNKAFRRNGFGSFLIQELKEECYLHHRVPAARCNIENLATRFALMKAGLSVSGFMLTGEVKK